MYPTHCPLAGRTDFKALVGCADRAGFGAFVGFVRFTLLFVTVSSLTRAISRIIKEILTFPIRDFEEAVTYR
jgi:hypothetical protein